ncbi:hypothetical protein LMJF_13_0840 [Leishmania major strain Friedlin]|uniref:Uncharacterized protein n=1 Tax=Leishmania major TaxID=5664 RepID=Q4QG70_LEIMA|nr:hypothetical protein LMJF_13_0840 [Leishmania major strain Friedlin]CAG9571021.1 hypothetical_protein_-_conserved [Leishmania major strain Friedlin]CAJ02773.1 hypothetical protein LMJF_13_0840 [Leishmania major strain Friedlin]|eukprot:XP_001681828.1 hypothetical protein LMJF_13_0840 [Leishmania major strain Friedlin]
MDACGWRAPGRRSKPFSRGNSRAPSYTQDGERARRDGRATSSASADAAASALRQQCETTRFLARLLAGLTLQWREVMTDLTEAEVPFNISDAAAAAAASKLGERALIEHHHHHRRRSFSPLQPRCRCCSGSAVAKSASKSYLTEERRFGVQAREAERALLRCREQRRAPSASLSDPCEGRSRHCVSGADASTLMRCLNGADEKGGGALRTDGRLCSTATNWHCLTPATQWIPYLLKDDAAVPHGTSTGDRRDLCESSLLYASPHRPRQYSNARMEQDGRDGEGVYVGSDMGADAQLRRAVLEGAARSVEVIILGMRQVCEVLSATAVTTVSNSDTDGSGRRRFHRGSHRSSSRTGPLSARSDSASRARSAEANQVSAHRRRRKSHEAHTQQSSGVAPPSIFITSAASPSRSQRRSQCAGDTPFATASAPAAVGSVLVCPAPPASERVYIYPRADRSATVLSPLRHRPYSAMTADVSATAPLSQWNRKLGWRATGATVPVGVKTGVAPATKSAASMDALSSLSDPSSAPTSPAQPTALQTASPTTRSRLPPSPLPSSVAAVIVRRTSQVRWAALAHEEGEARLRIVMAHGCRLMRVLRDHYERLRELEWESRRHSLATKIGALAGEQGAETVRAPAPRTAARVSTRASDTDDVADPVNSPYLTPSLSFPSVSTVPAHTETSSDVVMSPAAQIPPARNGGRDDEREGTPTAAQPSASTTAAAMVIVNTCTPSSPPQRQQPVWEMSSATHSRAIAARYSAAASHASRLPARRRPASHLPPVVLHDSSVAGAVTTSSAAADAPKAPASVLASASHPSAEQWELRSSPHVRPSALLQQLRNAAAVVDEEEKYAERTPSMARHAHKHPTGGSSCPLLSPLEESAEEAIAPNASSDFDSRTTAASTSDKQNVSCSADSSSSSVTYIVEENAERHVPSSTTKIAVGFMATAGDRAHLAAASRGPPPPPRVGANEAHLGNVEDDAPPSPRSDGAAPQNLAIAVELFPVGDTDASTACAPLSRKQLIFSPSPLPSVPNMNDVGNANMTTVDVFEVATVTDEADAASFSSVGSFHENGV